MSLVRALTFSLFDSRYYRYALLTLLWPRPNRAYLITSLYIGPIGLILLLAYIYRFLIEIA